MRVTSIANKYARQSVPRYTSYPTAPHFKAEFPEATYRDWLAELDPLEPISLYLHVPFCRQICWYCGCNMKLASRDGPIAEYAQALTAEIELLAKALPAKMKVSHVHLGGGTPTVLSPTNLSFLVERLESRFELMPDVEMAIESDPRSLSTTMVQTIGKLRFSRASFGVQEFDPAVQKAINRLQPPDMVSRAVERFRSVGLRSINFDLIYGLPLQTVESLKRTVELCVGMKPDRIALFGYAHVPWMAKNQRMISEASLPDPETRLAQASDASTQLLSAGYVRMGIDHFALPDDPLAIAAQNGKLRRNFQGYTTDNARTLLGIGATAIGQTPNGYVQNIAETGAWARAISAGKLPTAKGHRLSTDDAFRRNIILQIMCTGRADLAASARHFGAPENWAAGAVPELAELEKDGLIVLGEGILSVTAAGAPFTRVVAAAFDSFHKPDAAKHSAAV